MADRMPSRGFLMFAYNNPQVDYGLMALCNALMIKANCCEKHVSLVTDEGTIGWLKQSQGEALVNKAFDNIILDEIPTPDQAQTKRYSDTQYTNFELPWHNSTRASAYKLSPYDETILLDTDYLICDGALDHVWGSASDLRMNHRAMTLNHEPVGEAEQRLEPFGIPMYWATCVYFRKSDFAASIFDLVDLIRENYDYYQFVYKFPGRLFRNDFAFSIAAHIMSGWIGDGIDPLPTPVLLSSFDCDDLLDIPEKNELVLLIQDSTETWKYRATRLRNMSVHVMNKFSVIRNAPKIIALYGEDQ